MEKLKKLDIPIKLDEKELLNRINTGKSEKISGRMKKLISKAVKLIKEEAKGKALFSIHPLNKNGDNLLINNKVQIKSKKIFKILKACSKVLVFVSTIGESIEKKINHYMNDNPGYGYILDLAASLAAENAAEYVENYIAEKIKEQEDITYRYSPGYCDWHIKEQTNLFKIIDGKKIGVKLSGSSYMTPRKSVSGIIGICSNPENGFKGSACDYCSNNKCLYRRN